jgi:hypothetical protein
MLKGTVVNNVAAAAVPRNSRLEMDFLFMIKGVRKSSNNLIE